MDKFKIGWIDIENFEQAKNDHLERLIEDEKQRKRERAAKIINLFLLFNPIYMIFLLLKKLYNILNNGL